MKNIEYLTNFFRKHHLSGKIKVNFSSPLTLDENMTDIIFENGDVINIKDIIFDIESSFPPDVVEQWLEDKRQNDISLSEWFITKNHYIPKDFDTSSVDEYKKELTIIVDDIKTKISAMFEMQDDLGDSDLDEEDEDE